VWLLSWKKAATGVEHLGGITNDFPNMHSLSGSSGLSIWPSIAIG
jgi:hypothetical protein